MSNIPAVVGTPAWHAEMERERQAEEMARQNALPFDVAGAQSKLDQLNAEWERLAVNPGNNITRMEEIQKETDTLLTGLQKHDQTQAQTFQNQHAENRGKAERDLAILAQEHEQLSVNPSENWKKLQSIQGELDKRTTFIEQLERGETPSALEWKGG